MRGTSPYSGSLIAAWELASRVRGLARNQVPCLLQLFFQQPERFEAGHPFRTGSNSTAHARVSVDR